ncbi:MAG: hypothetical protein KAI47_07245, partial [Deltaproteobacteria bacterium]|nr:hypothetical protein [Deltaproteobacteria bacterium]
LTTYREVLQRDPRRWRALLQIGGIHAIRCQLQAANRIALALSRFPDAQASRIAALRRLVASVRPRCTAAGKTGSSRPTSTPTSRPTPPR